MKSIYFKQFKRSELSGLFYRRYRNLLTETIRNAKKQYQHDSFMRCKNDIKGTWKLINNLVLNKKCSKTISAMNVGGSETTDPKVIAQGFNDYFSSVAS